MTKGISDDITGTDLCLNNYSPILTVKFTRSEKNLPCSESYTPVTFLLTLPPYQSPRTPKATLLYPVSHSNSTYHTHPGTYRVG